MHAFAPDLLTEARGLSPALSGAAVGVGLLVWLLGWRLHRFWIVLGATVGAGLGGLATGQHVGPALVASGLLMAVAAGLLAMELARVAAFAVAGGLALVAYRAVLPAGGEPVLIFLIGGLLGVLLFRVWAMVSTALAGGLLIGYGGLCLAEQLTKFDAAAWAERNAIALDLGLIFATVLGVIVQCLLERLLGGSNRRRDRHDDEPILTAEQRYHLERLAPSRKGAKSGWWGGRPPSKRRAA
jgi:hypothetical protein